MRDIASIVGLKVISSKEGRDLGAVSQVIVDLASGALEGVIVGTGPSEKGIEAKDIQVIGADALMVETYRVARHLSELPRLMEKRRDPSRPPREVLTDTGKRLGVLGTIHIDPATKRVNRYEVSGGAWRDITEGVISLAPMEGTVDGRDSVVVPTSALSSLEGADGGLKAQLAKLAAVARSQARQAAESLEEGTRGIKRGAEAVKEKAAEAAAKVREAGREEGEAGPEAEKVHEGADSAAHDPPQEAGETQQQPAASDDKPADKS